MAKEENELETEEEEGEEQEESETSSKESKKGNKNKKKRTYNEAEKYAMSKIKNYLDEEAVQNELFAKKYPNIEKPIEKCWNYICEEMRKSSTQVAHHDTLYRLAKDFYNDNLESKDGDSLNNAKVASESAEEDEELKKYETELSPKEKAKLKEKAIKEFEESERKKLEAIAAKQKEAEAKKQIKLLEKQKAKEAELKEKSKKKTFDTVPLFIFED